MGHAAPKGRAMATFAKRVHTGLTPAMQMALEDESGAYPRIVVYLYRDKGKDTTFRDSFARARRTLGLVVLNNGKPVQKCGRLIAFDIAGTPEALEDFTSPYAWACLCHWENAMSSSVPYSAGGQGTNADARRAKQKQRAEWRANGGLGVKLNALVIPSDKEQAQRGNAREDAQRAADAREDAQRAADARIWEFWLSLCEGQNGEGI